MKVNYDPSEDLPACAVSGFECVYNFCVTWCILFRDFLKNPAWSCNCVIAVSGVGYVHSFIVT